MREPEKLLFFKCIHLKAQHNDLIDFFLETMNSPGCALTRSADLLRLSDWLIDWVWVDITENFALPGEAGFPLNAFYAKPNK